MINLYEVQKFGKVKVIQISWAKYILKYLDLVERQIINNKEETNKKIKPEERIKIENSQISSVFKNQDKKVKVFQKIQQKGKKSSDSEHENTNRSRDKEKERLAILVEQEKFRYKQEQERLDEELRLQKLIISEQKPIQQGHGRKSLVTQREFSGSEEFLAQQLIQIMQDLSYKPIIYQNPAAQKSEVISDAICFQDVDGNSINLSQKLMPLQGKPPVALLIKSMITRCYRHGEIFKHEPTKVKRIEQCISKATTHRIQLIISKIKSTYKYICVECEYGGLKMIQLDIQQRIIIQQFISFVRCLMLHTFQSNINQCHLIIQFSKYFTNYTRWLCYKQSGVYIENFGIFIKHYLLNKQFYKYYN